VPAVDAEKHWTPNDEWTPECRALSKAVFLQRKARILELSDAWHIEADKLGLIKGQHALVLACWHCNERKGFHAYNMERNKGLYDLAMAADTDGSLSTFTKLEGDRTAELALS
jgi:hypothetical protein